MFSSLLAADNSGPEYGQAEGVTGGLSSTWMTVTLRRTPKGAAGLGGKLHELRLWKPLSSL
jgi:hypothetical protein